jgi:hypothetical protein
VDLLDLVRPAVVVCIGVASSISSTMAFDMIGARRAVRVSWKGYLGGEVSTMHATSSANDDRSPSCSVSGPACVEVLRGCLAVGDEDSAPIDAVVRRAAPVP